MQYNKITLTNGLTLRLTLTEWEEFEYLYAKAKEVGEIAGLKELFSNIDRTSYDWGSVDYTEKSALSWSIFKHREIL